MIIQKNDPHKNLLQMSFSHFGIIPGICISRDNDWSNLKKTSKLFYTEKKQNLNTKQQQNFTWKIWSKVEISDKKEKDNLDIQFVTKPSKLNRTALWRVVLTTVAEPKQVTTKYNRNWKWQKSILHTITRCKHNTAAAIVFSFQDNCQYCC